MELENSLRSPGVRRALAAGVIVVSIGGLVLMRSPAHANHVHPAAPAGESGASFSGPGASGSLALSQSKLASEGDRRFFAQLRLRATETEVEEGPSSPISLAIVLDTSGSMSGEKIERAKHSVTRLIQSMRDSDEVALVRYASYSQLIQPLVRVGEARSELAVKISAIRAGGGTNIPPALSDGYRALELAGPDRVKRVVLVSDGLDSTRQQSELLARAQLDGNVTTSALGIGLDFDESYMAGVANAGRGNFGFVRDAAALAQFLDRELNETVKTTIDTATATLELPAEVRFVRAMGADASRGADGEVELRLGALFGGDERRIVVELSAQPELGETLSISGDVRWHQVGGDTHQVALPALSVTGVHSAEEAFSSRDPTVYASCISALASVRQLEAARAYAQGDVRRAELLIDNNETDLQAAASAAPDEAAAPLQRQATAYRATRDRFRAAPPASPEGRAAAKRSTAEDNGNLMRAAY